MNARLSASELRYRRLFEAARDGILIIDLETRKIIDVNPFLVEFLGYRHDEFLGKELYEIGLLRDAEASRAAFEALRAEGYIRYEDLPLKTKQGRLVDVEFVSNIYHEGEKWVIQCNFRDITARKKTEKSLNLVRDQLSTHLNQLETTVKLRTAELLLSNTQLETFVYSIAHDLRAPLRTMQGFSQLLVEERSIGLSRDGSDYANFINKAAQSMDRLLADLLAFSHVSQQKIELDPVSLESIVLSALDECSTEITQSRALVNNTTPWPVVLAHGPTLRQILINLIGNALKFVAPGKDPVLHLWAEVLPNRVIRMWVEDNGIGIPPQFQERIFQVFQRLHTSAYTGTGIGLAIVQKGMERMHGRVGLISSAAEGSRFWIELPQAPIVTVVDNIKPVAA